MSEEQMRVLRMIEEGKISAEDGAKLLGVLNAGAGPVPPVPPMPPMPPMPPIPPIPPGASDRQREQIERDYERAMRDYERARERAEREAEQARERAEREAERARERGRRDRGERGRGRGGPWAWGSVGDDVFWGARRGETRDTGPLPETGPGGARWFRVRVTDVRSGKVKVNVSLPMGLINFGLKLGAKYIPEEAGFNVEEIRQAVRSGMVGKIIEVEDSDDGERVEVFVE